MAMGLDFSRYAELYRGELFDRVLPFWLEHAPDGEHGGVFTCLDRRGAVYSPDKSVWMQGRCLWMFSHLSNGFGARDEWLSIAASCKSFLDEHCFDKDGRMFFSVLGDGRPLRKRRYFFSEAFYIIGAAEYALATGDSGALEDARRVYALVRAIHRDPASDPFRVPP
ncbi:MAG: N-acylglucosamine 2-epimerase, partial [Clostridiales bacterium]|nr:N-acylglucosamine 2-epimerase [Clostridiales bacterium]